MVVDQERPGPIRVALVDDHEMVRVGLSGLIEGQPDLCVVGQAATADEALAMMRTTMVDVLVLDLRIPGGSGIDVCRSWRSVQPATHVVVLTSFADDDLLFNALAAGARGYLLKSTRGPQLLEAIRTVAHGGSVLDPSLAHKIGEQHQKPVAPDPIDLLTEQEHRILSLIAEGLTNRRISERVRLSERTVKHHVSSILSKLGLARRAEAAAYAARHGVDRSGQAPHA